MKILYVCLNRLINETSGPRVHVMSVCQELEKRGHRILIIQPKGAKCENFINNDPIKTVCLPNFILRDIYVFQPILFYLYILTIMLLYRPKFIYERASSRRSLRLISNLLRIPRVVELNGWPLGHSENSNAEKSRIINKYRKDFKGAQDIIVSSPGVRQKVIKHIEIEENQVHYVPNGVDIEKFSPPVNYQPQNDQFVIGYVGGFTNNQDILSIINAVKILSEEGVNLELRLIGDCRYIQSELEQIIATNQLYGIVRLYGVIPHHMIPKEIWAMDICVIAYNTSLIKTIGSLEGAMKIWEYWASRRPVVATDLVGSSSYHHHIEGRYFAVDPENPQAMAKGIKFLITHPEIRDQLANNGYEYVMNNHSWGKVATNIEAIMLNTDIHY